MSKKLIFVMCLGVVFTACTCRIIIDTEHDIYLHVPDSGVEVLQDIIEEYLDEDAGLEWHEAYDNTIEPFK